MLTRSRFARKAGTSTVVLMTRMSDGTHELRDETVRGAAGFFRVGQRTSGAWTLIDPEGRSFFAIGVNEVDAEAAAPVAWLREWGFNTLGAGSAAAWRGAGLAWVGMVDFCAVGPLIHTGGVRLPDVFDPDWPQTAGRRAAEVCAPARDDQGLLGWLSDDELGWGPAKGVARPTLLQVCLSLEPGFAAYHAAWEFVLASHGGTLAALGKAWGLPLTNREVVRELTRSEVPLASRGYARDAPRWTREVAARYFAGAAAAIRGQDPNHLVLGARVHRGEAGAVALGLGAFPQVDLPWVRVEDLGAAPAGPLLVGEFSWVTEAFWGAPTRGLTSVERMLRRGRAALQRLGVHPTVVGYAWRQWRDRAEEQPPFAGGLVHANGAAAREHVELVADINRTLATLRAPPSSTRLP